MTQLNAFESALYLVELAQKELDSVSHDLRAQLALIRMRAAAEALRGKVDMEEFERKVLGDTKTENRPQPNTQPLP